MKTTTNWETIVDTLIQEFEQDGYKKGEKMPSESKMAARFDTTRAEVRRAYLHLKEQGYIYSQQGYGSFFSGKKEKIRLILNDSQNFTEKMDALGIHYRTENVGFERIKDNMIVSEMFELSEEEADFHDIYKLTLLRFVDDEPVAIRVSYLPDYAFPDLAQHGSSLTSLRDYMHACGYSDFTDENYEFSVSALDKKERALFDIKGFASCLVMSSRCVDQTTGRVLEVARTIYRSDKFIFTF
jgi:DNA-binding GntR family transcriptional regulator|nr:GntR family transcriptional regulator [uncultured Faecalimonas sp.]